MQIDTKEESDGGWSFSAHLEPRLGAPFARALMRVEARLLLEDADQTGRSNDANRSHEQRAVDALVVLVKSIADASEKRRRGRELRLPQP